MKHSEAVAKELRAHIASVEDELRRLRQALDAVERKRSVGRRNGRVRRTRRVRTKQAESAELVAQADQLTDLEAEPGAYLTEAATALKPPRRQARRK